MTEINIYVTMTALKDNCTLDFSVFSIFNFKQIPTEFNKILLIHFL